MFLFKDAPVVPEVPIVTIEGSCRSVALSRDDRYTAASTYQGHLYIINTRTGAIVSSNHNKSSGAIRRLQFTKSKKKKN